MKIKDILLYVPYGLISNVTKMYRARLIDDEKIMNKVMDEGMYHVVPNQDVAEKIMESGYLKQASGNVISKAINSYGLVSVACLFAGRPDIDNFVKNVTDTKLENNPYLNPSLVSTAIHVMPKDKEQLVNYKTRNISDCAILYEGNCVLDSECIEIEKLVPDLVRDESLNPIKNTKGEYSIVFRRATEEELQINPESGKERGNTNRDYLAIISELAKEKGYTDKNGIMSKVNNSVNNVLHQGSIEGDTTFNNIKENFSMNIRNVINRIKQRLENFGKEKMPESVEMIIENYHVGNTLKKNPFQDEKFAKFVGNLDAKDGLKQIKLKDALEKLNNSELGRYAFDKYETIKDRVADRKGIHGIGHFNRTLMNAMFIAQDEEIFAKDKDNRMKDILISSAMYHDIGRIGNNGPHARRSARKVSKMDLRFYDGKNYSDEDKKILMAIIEAHDGNENKIDKMIKKYKIDEKDIEMVKNLCAVLRDADALDRVRLDRYTLTNTKTNLDPNYLRTTTAKRLLTCSYELENLIKHTSIENAFDFHRKETAKKGPSNDFIDRIKVDPAEINIDLEMTKKTPEDRTKRS